ncbi:MAG: hypothetical protein HKN45_04315 [Flavobacteriales bacterium]|nr:hypothetical protein [Flavobacteriales bacterium]
MARYVRIYGNAIHEYDTNHSSGTDGRIRSGQNLSYPRNSGDGAYRVGDFLFTSTMRKSMAAHMIREFRDALDSEHSVGSFVMHLLELDEITISYRVESIVGTGNSARIRMRPMLKISDNEALELNARSGRNGLQEFTGHTFQHHFRQNYHARTATVWIPIGRFVLQVVTLPFGGAVRSAASRVVGPMVRRFGMRVLRRLLRSRGRRIVAYIIRNMSASLVSFIFDVSKDSAKGVVSRYSSQLRNNQLRGTVDPSFVRNINVDQIVREAIQNSVAKNLSGLVVKGIQSAVPGTPETGVDDFLPESVESNVSRFITRRLLIPSVMTPITKAIRSTIMAIDFTGDERSYEQRFSQHLNRELGSAFSSGTALTRPLTGALRQLVSSPELLF